MKSARKLFNLFFKNSFTCNNVLMQIEISLSIPTIAKLCDDDFIKTTIIYNFISLIYNSFSVNNLNDVCIHCASRLWAVHFHLFRTSSRSIDGIYYFYLLIINNNYYYFKVSM